MKPAICTHLLALSAAVLLSTNAVCAQPAPAKGYSVSIFAAGTEKYTAPDSIALANGHIFVGYGGPGLPDGSDGKSSYIIEYTVTAQRFMSTQSLATTMASS